MKIWVVDGGTYSDYSVKGFFSTKEKAQKFMDTCRASEACWDKDFNDPYEVIIDIELKQKEYTRFTIGIMVDTGEVKEGPSQQQYFGIPENRVYVCKDVPIYDGRNIIRAESHKTADHAMKLAVEARQAELRGADIKAKGASK